MIGDGEAGALCFFLLQSMRHLLKTPKCKGARVSFASVKRPRPARSEQLATESAEIL
jgi:hypothetical protein